MEKEQCSFILDCILLHDFFSSFSICFYLSMHNSHLNHVWFTKSERIRHYKSLPIKLGCFFLYRIMGSLVLAKKPTVKHWIQLKRRIITKIILIRKNMNFKYEYVRVRVDVQHVSFQKLLSTIKDNPFLDLADVLNRRDRLKTQLLAVRRILSSHSHFTLSFIDLNRYRSVYRN